MFIRKPLFYLSALAFAFAANAHADIVFRCDSSQHVEDVKTAVARYIADLNVPASALSWDSNSIGFVLTTSASVTESTTTLRFSPQLGIEDETVLLPKGKNGELTPVATVSKKEILLALASPGRQTEFAGPACSLNALQEHIGVRQNIVAWAEKLNWRWPNGGPAEWNSQFWNAGTPLQEVPLEEALRNTLVEQDTYAIGCYTATKLVIAQGIADYYSRIHGDKSTWEAIKARFWSNKDPLVGIEPRRMWAFEDDFDPTEMHVAGKLLQLQEGVQPGNFVPGDWAYFLNTDKASWEKTGYEGSNAIYLGRNRFNDHYDDNNGHYLYHEKLRMVYQWRNSVFSRSRDFDKMTKVSPGQLQALEGPPETGGFVLPYRAVPYFFGHQALPASPKP